MLVPPLIEWTDSGVLWPGQKATTKDVLRSAFYTYARPKVKEDSPW